MKTRILFAILICFITVEVYAQTETKAVTGTNVGNIAPEIALNNPEGKVMKLSSLRGNLVLIDFWASWCGPCRRENPNVVEAYNTYSKLKIKNAKGFQIFSVSLDKSADAWKAAIKDDKLDWKYHVSELNMWDSKVVKTYMINSIPSNLLIDEKGVIIAKNLRGENLLLELEKHVKY
jgi:thiol-disulfide isomerase/thioredoxin